MNGRQELDSQQKQEFFSSPPCSDRFWGIEVSFSGSKAPGAWS